ncbi:hypothetical protein QBC33DRAFT_331566 [Phialemonium atrogriseum]|uniref:Uncharacterized protein n=1 Tax=Phialemonium atrogriseum TaxID=1093897 RepID=A0AAJ0C4B2_9PEZI|nr:uncharacterized protein QBC33DRAFT_331566 [Phialemonium atrogriseum]KAK1769681.1 hypothetical protein QBC33DRAFT_331566 [Phialemonium atrogriseum]
MSYVAAVVLFIFLLAASALPDYSCVCEKANINACSRSYSCRLNSSISFDSPPIPEWVTDKEKALFADTITQAKNGSLRPPVFDLGQLTWQSKLACDYNNGKKWYQTTNGCQSSNKTGKPSRHHGWASLGFHPLGTASGTWLTQILGEIDNPDGDERFMNASCASTGLFINLTYINATPPYDPRFSPAASWGFLYRSNTYAMGSDGVPSYRTDQDLIANGVDINCTGFGQTGQPCESPHCLEPPNFAHYDCPATNSGSVGSGNCWRSYQQDSSVGRTGLYWGLIVSAALCCGFLYV